mmetsp:Transcript_24459/g.31612  ORF Transcript_24459/g.31612 Transcript_24459/m.31612 type:complete len:358 (-) Transcript_24459:49-1122(-)
MRYTRSRQDSKYAASTAVLLSEILKTFISFFVFCKGQGSEIMESFLRVQRFMITHPLEMGKIAVPSGLYTIQNYLQYVAVTNLDGPTFQLMSQVKILTTACFSVLLLHKRLMSRQWSALLLLVSGVCFVQLSINSKSAKQEKEVQSNFIGLLSVITACCTSGFAGVYFEKVLKGSDISLWMRNIHMSLLGILLGLVSMWCNDGRSIIQDGFFHGYTWTVWVVIFLQAAGGILVSLVVKYADNLLKGFATSLSIVLSCVVSKFLGDLHLTLNFVLGAFLILMASFLYGMSSFKEHHIEDPSPKNSTANLKDRMSPPTSRVDLHISTDDMTTRRRAATGDYEEMAMLSPSRSTPRSSLH